MKVDYVKSPKTGRMVKVGGDAHAKLIASAKYGDATKKARKVKRETPGSKTHQKGKVTSVKKINLVKAKPRPLGKTLASVPKSRKARRSTLQSEMEHTGEGRGGRTRGWAAAAPQKGTERHRLKNECGEVCFLKPDSEGFPICAALREGQGCKVDCRGVTAARVRAAQWKYPKVSKTAEALERKYSC